MKENQYLKTYYAGSDLQIITNASTQQVYLDFSKAFNGSQESVTKKKSFYGYLPIYQICSQQ